MPQQFKAAYLCDAVLQIFQKALKAADEKAPLEGLLKYASSFDVEWPENTPAGTPSEIHPHLAVANNLLCRGLPTRAPLLVEETLHRVGLTGPNEEKYKYAFDTNLTNLDQRTAKDLLHFIEPGRSITKEEYAGELGSHFEWQFLDKQLAEWPFAKQILQPQRDFASINGVVGGERTVDFTYSRPQHATVAGSRYGTHTVGVVFEVDGPHHDTFVYRTYDRYRDDAAQEAGFNTIRTTSLLDERATTELTELFEHGHFNRYKRNYARTVADDLSAYTLVLVPIVVARIQRTIIEWLIRNPAVYAREEVKIAVIGRDLPGAALAVAQLQEVLDNLAELTTPTERTSVPRLTLFLFPEEKWTLDQALHLEANTLTEADFSPENYDLVIDHSILRRSGILKETTYLTEQVTVIRSAHFFDSRTQASRRTYCAEPIVYQPLVTRRGDGGYDENPATIRPICYFLKNVFRKQDFREGQLPIISRAMQQLAVIGLLPTGGGKSITFQLSAFLQPGLCLIVDPIKSLMEDQVRVLKENWIDNCAYINSNLDQKEKKAVMTDHTYGESQFFFVSPERLVMTEFRQMVKNIHFRSLGLAYAYCVIDEVHCVSEWGHDFRTTYLMLGRNAQRFIHTKSPSENVCLVGLTATASFDVLADIERELDIQTADEANAVITLENTVRPELFFRVLPVGQVDRIAVLNQDFSRMPTNLAHLNQPGILRSAQKHHQKELEGGHPFTEEELEDKIMGLSLPADGLAEMTQNDLCSIIFCPVKGTGGHILGVDFVRQNINSGSVGYYYSDEDTFAHGTNPEIAKSFAEFTEGNLKHIVCTKAFGMGIDKENIRTTYHYNYSGSLESFVQEAGRSGRDKKVAEAVVLVAEYETYALSSLCLQYAHPEDQDPTKPEEGFSPIRNTWHRKGIRIGLLKNEHNFPTKEQAETAIRACVEDFNFITLPQVEALVSRLNEWIVPSNPDKSIHEFFHSKSYRGVNTEKQQMYTLFTEREFLGADAGAGEVGAEQGTLEKEFDKAEALTFPFILTKSKTYRSQVSKIAELLGVNPAAEINPPNFTRPYGEAIENAYKYADDFQDYLLQLDEISGNVNPFGLDQAQKRQLKQYFNYPRNANATGRLIYRMHSAGLLEDYTIDYRLNSIHGCTLQKFATIKKYHEHIELYLKRYLSEIVAIQKMEELRERCNKDTLTSNLLQCLYFLAEFAYTEIADKRKRATDEIDRVMRTCITDPELKADNEKANFFIKEEIYYYFNAKYARAGFKIGDQDYSLLEDHRNEGMSRAGVLKKYLVALNAEGSQQNNYKHLIGSCKKIIRSLSESDLKREWALLLLKAFAMYAVNNASYVSEANADLITGFTRLYDDDDFHKNDLITIEHHFTDYFDRLKDNIQADNPSFRDIEAIRLGLLFQLQSKMITQLLELT
jgi:superfamily II DNA helicase RecQ